MLNLSEHNIGIQQVEFYVPDKFQNVTDYLKAKPEEFSMAAMQATWKAGHLEPEFVYRFFCQATAGSNSEVARLSSKEIEEFATQSGIDRVYSASDETASDMAVKVAKRILSREPNISDQIDAVVHYSSTLNERLASSTPGRLQYETGLKNTFGFTVDQKNGSSSFIALKIAIEMLLAEPNSRAILLAGSDKLAPPYQRVINKATVIGDSASSMIVRRGSDRCRILALGWADFPEWWNTYAYDEEQVRGFYEFPADKSALLLDETLASLGIGWQDVALLIPPNISQSFIRHLTAWLEIDEKKVYTKNISRYGHLMASDMLVNLATALEEGAVRTGDIVVILTLGIGHSIGSLAIEV